MDGWYGQRDQVGWMLNARLMGKTLLTPWSTYWPPLRTNIVILRVRMTMQSTIDRRLSSKALHLSRRYVTRVTFSLCSRLRRTSLR